MVDGLDRLDGGRVVLDNGDYVSGSIYLKDGVTLWIDEDSSLLGSLNPFDYIKDPDAKWTALIFAVGQKNIGIEGGGTVNGRTVPIPEIKAAAAGLHQGDMMPFELTQYEANPLVRVAKVTGAGEQWHSNDRSVRTDRMTNRTSVDSLRCRLLTAEDGGDTVMNVRCTGDYADGTLYNLVGFQTENVRPATGHALFHDHDVSDDGGTVLMSFVEDAAEPVQREFQQQAFVIDDHHIRTGEAARPDNLNGATDYFTD